MMDKPKFVYVSYINSTPEKVFNALIDPEMTKKYWWNHHNASDWKTGSKWEHRDYDNPSKVDIVGQVIESNPPNKLVVSWARPADEHNAERTSRVTYDIETSSEGVVRLTITHDELDEEMFESISTGWPGVVSALKTLLETGSVGAQTTSSSARKQ